MRIYDNIVGYARNKKKWFKAYEVIQEIVLLKEEQLFGKEKEIFKT
jgi:hypothetical protein